jgi:transposase
METSINSKEYIQFIEQRMVGRTRPLSLIVDRASSHCSKLVSTFVCRHSHRIRLHYLPVYSPERNPDEHAREEIKDKRDLKKRLHATLKSLQHRTARVISFFHRPETQYVAQ